ncbi:MAG: sensor histidine kinase [Candidatus Dormibacter sp.]|uniref:sensor histidine kinase n=1 Tax=Candidatus Dormibacter sp. TaxID=2973982 RepID=UPI000DB52207|nr:MAG: histidine kinase [Candidatus Dormibacteraeota bacterium]
MADRIESLWIRLRQRVWRGLGLVWLLLLVFEAAAYYGHPHPFQDRLLVAATVLVFVAVDVWFITRAVSASLEAPRIRPRSHQALAAILVMVGLSFVLVSFDGADFAAAFYFPVIGAAFAFRSWRGWSLIPLVSLAIFIAALAGGTPWYYAALYSGGMLFTGLFMVGIAALIRSNRQLQAAREEVARLAVSDERLRFARDLHDLLGHSLSVMVLKAELAHRLAGQSPELAAQQAADIERVGRQALREVREAVEGYRQPSLEQELVNAKSGLKAAGVSLTGPSLSDPLPAVLDSTLAWALREGVTNVLRHSHATAAVLRLEHAPEEAILELTDDGCAHEPGFEFKQGHGLHGLRERVEARQGHLQAGPTPDGFRLFVRLPLKQAPVAASAA